MTSSPEKKCGSALIYDHPREEETAARKGGGDRKKEGCGFFSSSRIRLTSCEIGRYGSTQRQPVLDTSLNL